MSAELEIRIVEEGAQEQPASAQGPAQQPPPAAPASPAPQPTFTQPQLYTPNTAKTMIAPNPMAEIQQAVIKKLEDRDKRKAIEALMRAQSPEYAQEQEEREQKRRKKETVVEPEPTAETLAMRRLETMAQRKAIDAAMRAQSPEYAQEQASKEAKSSKAMERQAPTEEARAKKAAEEKMTLEERAERNAKRDAERENLKRATDQARRAQDKEYAAQAEVTDAQKARAASIHEIIERNRQERVDLDRMSQDERVEYLARKKAASEAESQKVKDRAEQLAGGKPQFDPYARAKESREAEIRSEQVKAAHEDMYGKSHDQEDPFMQAAGAMRGSLGAAFGPLVGAGLDLYAAYRQYNKPKSDARQEAERRNRNLAQGQGPEQQQSQSPPRAQPRQPNQAQPPQQPPPRQTATDTSEWWPTNPQRRWSGQQAQGATIPTAPIAPPGSGSSAPYAIAAPASPGGGGPPGGGGGTKTMDNTVQQVASAVPVVGPVVAAAVAVSLAIRDATGSFVKGIGDAAASMATLKDGAERIRGVGEGLSSAGEKIFFFSAGLGLATLVAGKAAEGVASLDVAVRSTAERLGQYNGRLATQNAEQEVTELIRDINRANRFGDRTADANAARFAMEQRLQDITDRFIPFIMRISEQVFRALERGFAMVDDGFTNGIRLLDNMLEIAQVMNIANPIFQALLGGTIQQIRDMLREMLGNNSTDTVDRVWDNFLMGINNIEGVGAVNPMPMVPRPDLAIQRP